MIIDVKVFFLFYEVVNVYDVFFVFFNGFKLKILLEFCCFFCFVVILLNKNVFFF